MTDRLKKHNELTREFVMRFGKECSSYAELMVVVESMLMACMLVNTKVFLQKPHVASGLVEAAVQRAIDRFAKDQKNEI